MDIHHLFDNGKTIACVRIADLAESILFDPPGLGLPKFQRDAVWDHARVEVLWDSLLRGFPLGCIILAESGHEIPMKRLVQYRDAQPDQGLTAEFKADYMIIDGQQRANAISLGFQSNRRARLWVDLIPPPETSDMRYQFYLCTTAQPWGSNSTDEKRLKARKWLFSANRSLLRDGSRRLPDWELSLEETWPVAAVLPVPFDKLMTLCRGDQPRWEDVEGMIPVYYKKEAVDTYIANSQKAKDKLPAFAGAVKRCAEQHIPLQLVPASAYTPEASLLPAGDKPADFVAQELETLFARLNTQGMRMGADDLFFSAIKTRIPDAHDLVWKIYAGQGRLLPPPALVHMASRIVVANHTEKDDGTFLSLEAVGVHTLRFLTRNNYDSECFIEDFEKYVKDEQFGKVFAITRELLQFDARMAEAKDGFPIPMLVELPARCRRFLWHVVAAWVDSWIRSGKTKEEILAQRLEVLRYAMVDTLLASSDRAWPSNEVFKIARTSNNFPARRLIQRYKETGLLDVLRKPDESELLNFPDHEEYRRSLDEQNGFRWLFINQRLLLMWSQRKFIDKCFPNYDPSSFVRAEEKPYDFDHILPRGSKIQRTKEEETDFIKWRDSIGNLRVWPKGENRHDQNSPVSDKLLLGRDGNYQLDGSRLRHEPCAFTVAQEVWDASLIEPEIWQDVDQSLDAFIHAVKERLARMYETLYRTFKINELQ